MELPNSNLQTINLSSSEYFPQLGHNSELWLQWGKPINNCKYYITSYTTEYIRQRFIFFRPKHNHNSQAIYHRTKRKIKYIKVHTIASRGWISPLELSQFFSQLQISNILKQRKRDTIINKNGDWLCWFRKIERIPMEVINSLRFPQVPHIPN
jgi:hypothetical protein